MRLPGLNALDAPSRLLSALQFEPAKARGRAPVWAADTTRVEETDGTAKFIPGDMGVAMEEQIEAFGRQGRRDVFEPDAHPFDFEIELLRPVGKTVAVALNDSNWGSDLRKGIDQDGRAHVAEMPYLVGAGDPCQDLGRQSIMSVGEDCDPHGEEIADFGLRIADWLRATRISEIRE
jgi:hypothetical protein